MVVLTLIWIDNYTEILKSCGFIVFEHQHSIQYVLHTGSAMLLYDFTHVAQHQGFFHIADSGIIHILHME